MSVHLDGLDYLPRFAFFTSLNAVWMFRSYAISKFWCSNKLTDLVRTAAVDCLLHVYVTVAAPSAIPIVYLPL